MTYVLDFDYYVVVRLVIGLSIVVIILGICITSVSAYTSEDLRLDYLIRTLINWKSEGKITNDEVNRALDYVININEPKKQELSLLITKYKSVAESTHLEIPILKEPLDSEHNLFVYFQSGSIPSEELLEVCTNQHVLDRTYVDLRSRCDQAMDVMMMEYCQTNTGYQYTLCRDHRVDQFYGRTPHTENIPDPSIVSKINDIVEIKNLKFVVTGFDVLNNGAGSFSLQVYVTLENLASQTEYVSVDDFKIIDEKGNILNINEFGQTGTITQVEKVLSKEKIEGSLYGTTTWHEGNILKITLANESRYVGLERQRSA